MAERQKQIIAGLPNVDSVLAIRLLQEFKTPKQILLASKEDLQNIKGIGATIAALIRETIDSDYSE